VSDKVRLGVRDLTDSIIYIDDKLWDYISMHTGTTEVHPIDFLKEHGYFTDRVCLKYSDEMTPEFFDAWMEFVKKNITPFHVHRNYIPDTFENFKSKKYYILNNGWDCKVQSNVIYGIDNHSHERMDRFINFKEACEIIGYNPVRFNHDIRAGHYHTNTPDFKWDEIIKIATSSPFIDIKTRDYPVTENEALQQTGHVITWNPEQPKLNLRKKKTFSTFVPNTKNINHKLK
jgi:hypothetical protein